MVSSHKTLKEILSQRQQEEFVGREQQLEIYTRNLSLPIEQRRFVFSISGQGGVGKTSLLRRLRQLTQANESITAWSDENDYDIPSVMGRMALELETHGLEMKSFKERYRVYRQRRQELESDPDAPNGLPSFLGRSLAKTGVHLARRAPAVGIAFDFVDEEAFAAQAGEWMTYIAKKVANKDEVKLIKEPIEVLTPLFLEGLNKTREGTLIGLFLDTYERTSEYLDGWLRNIINERYGPVPVDIIISIAGQVELDRNVWAPYEGLLVRFPLDLFTTEEVRNYLVRKGITNQQVVEVITHLSGQLPLLVATLATESPNSPDRLGDPSGTAVERFLKWVEDPKRRQVALDSALPRQINQDILSALIREDSNQLYEWLRKMPFVRDGGLKYHPVVRTQILRYKLRNSPQGWASLHGILAEYHRVLRDDHATNIPRKYVDPIWQKHALEAVYHQLCQSPHKRIETALNQFLLFFEASRRFAREWAEAIHQAGEDSENPELKRWGTKLIDGIRAFEEDRYADAASMFTTLLNDERIDDVSRSLSLDYRGLLFGRAAKYEKALEDLKRAADLDPQNADYMLHLGETYRRMKRYDDAVDLYSQAITLRPKSVRALTGRGHALLEMGSVSSAFSDFSTALGLRPNYAWALLGRGRVFAARRRTADARSDFEKASQINAEYEHVAQKEIGKSLITVFNYEDAASAFVKAVNAGPRCVECWSLLVQVLKASSNAANVIDRLHHVFLIDSSNTALLPYRGEALRRVGLLHAALDDLSRAIHINVRDTSALKSRAMTLTELGRFDEALQDLNHFLALETETAIGFFLRGDILLRTRKPADALPDFYKALQLDASFTHAAQQKLGIALRILKRPQEAKAAFVESLIARPDCSVCWLDLAKTCAELVSREDVIACIEQVIFPDGSKPSVIASRAQALMDMGFFDQALNDIEKAMSLDANLFASFGNSYGLLLSQRGRYADAIAVYERLLQETESNSVLYNLAVATVRHKGIHEAQAQIAAAEAILKETQKRKSNDGSALYGLAGLSALSGYKEAALHLLEEAAKHNSEVFNWLKYDVAWKDIEHEPRLQTLLQTGNQTSD